MCSYSLKFGMVFIILICSAFAGEELYYPKRKLYIFVHEVEEGDKWKSIRVKYPYEDLAKTEFRKLNSSMINGEKIRLRPGKKLFIPFKIRTNEEGEKYLLVKGEKANYIKKISKRLRVYDPSLLSFAKVSAFVFYAASAGSYQEKISDGTLTQSQNSPVTLGLGMDFAKKNEGFFSASSYISLFAKSQKSGVEATTPPEIGLTGYYNRKLTQSSAVYGGLDYERLYTFNTGELINDPNAKIDFRTQSIFYGTIGGRHNFSLGSKLLVIRLSGSHSLLSNASKGNDYTGFKLILHSSYQLAERVFLNAFAKRHMLEGEGKLTITRIGLGASYSF